MKTVYSCNGELVISDTGEVIPDKSIYDNDILRNIVQFDLEEYNIAYPNEPKPDFYDILDLGYWMVDGKYEPPAYDWRKEIRSGN